MTFNALVVDHSEPRASIRTLERNDLPVHGNVLVRVDWSSINYKDAMAVTGQGKIIRSELPFVPGIDLAGTVVESDDPEFPPGSAFLSTGWGVGEVTWGGYSRYQWMSSEWLVPMPEGLDARQAMITGTAGFTAMLSLQAIREHGLAPEAGPIVVTGATGGVGSFSVMLLAAAGYEVVAVTGKSDAEAYLKALGAERIVPRSVFEEGARRPLDAGEWAGCVDSVGSRVLEAIVSQTMRHGVIAACGLAAGPELNTTVYPFILRGVRLIGIDSNTCPQPARRRAWNGLRDLADRVDFERVAHTVPLDGVPEASRRLMAGGIQGRFVVDLRNEGP
ncbi:MAG: oxidoreductase [Bacteroidetes bacterium]|nr:oxidoreductase [Bacteroidota bacterium]